MALLLADRVKVRSLTTGTGTVTLTSIVAGFQGFSVIGDGNETYYGITDTSGNWEVGRGTYTSVTIGDTTTEYLSRDSVVSSSNINQLVDFPVGGKNVFCTFPSTVALDLIGGASSDSFKTISVTGQSSVVADSSTDTLTLEAGNGVTITTNATTDTITFEAAGANTANTGFVDDRIYNLNGVIVSNDDLVHGATARLSIPEYGDTVTPVTVYNNYGNISILNGPSGTITNTWQFNSNGNLELPAGGSVTQNWSYTRTSNSIEVALATPTVVWTSVDTWTTSAKLVIQVEGYEAGDTSGWHTQSCEAIIAARANNGDPHITVYGVTHTSALPLITFTISRNLTTNFIEVTATPTAALGNSAWIRTHSIEMISSN